jgi:hypothetical protein
MSKDEMQISADMNCEAAGTGERYCDFLPSTGDGAAADLPPQGCPQSDAATPSEPKDASGKRIIDYIHPVSLALFALAGISGILLFAFYKSVAFSDFFNERISSIFRFLLAKITNPLPFSLAETVIFSLPIFVVAAVVRTVRISKHSSAKNCRFILGLLSILSLLFSMFVLNFAAAYRGSTLEDKLGLERSKVSADELVATAYALLDKIGGVIDDVQFDYGSFSIMPYSLSELSENLCDAYASVCKKYPFLQSMRTKVKPIVLSEPMTYTHISGVYSYFTGEANINTNFPDYTLPFTAAHELSHQRGIAREDEANFMAFLVCIESDDPYIQYSGYFNMLGYVINSLYTADSAEYMRIWMSMDRRLVSEFIAYSNFFDKYRESKVSKVSEKVNDTYLKIQGQAEGTRSYGWVVDLAVAYAKLHFGVESDTGG